MILRGRRQRCRMARRANPSLAILNPQRRRRVRANPALAILNPPRLAPTLRRLYARLSGLERAEFLKGVRKYQEFHGVPPTGFSTVGTVQGSQRRFLVGMGATEDVSYSTNRPGEYRGSQKHGTPFRHEFPSKPHMATSVKGDHIVILNRQRGRRFGVADWIRG
jgi:hypothetical protein